MFDHLRDPFPPDPTTADHDAVTRRGRGIVRRRRARAALGGLGALALVLAGGFAVFDTENNAVPTATEVAGTTDSNPSTTTEPPIPTPPPDVPVPGTAPLVIPFVIPFTPAPEPPPPPPPSADSTLAVEVVVPAGWSITGCSVSGSPVALTGNTFTLVGLAPGSTVDVVCDAQSGDGAARAGRSLVTLQPGLNRVQLTL